MAASKRKRASVDTPKENGDMPAPPKRRTSTRNSSTAAAVNPDLNGDIFDAPNATRASPDGNANGDIAPNLIMQEVDTQPESPLSDPPAKVEPPKKRGRKSNGATKVQEDELVLKAVVDDASAARKASVKKGKGGPKIKEEHAAEEVVATAVPIKQTAVSKTNDESGDPEVDGLEEADEEEVKEALSRPPPVHSDYLPLPWKGRLGYACLNTYLRNSNPPVFSSRTCRIQSILEHRHPLQDPTQPEHATKNRPDKSKPADVELGKRYVEALCIANVKDIIKMVRWNHKYNIRFFRLSSEMFPFASHPEYGYKLAPFASEALAEAGKVVGELGHRVTTHPGQFTQLGSPRKQVVDNALRDLNYHDEMLSLLKLPEQQNKDAIMVLHMGGMFEGKAETLQRFRENYANLSQSVKNRLVLENDDVIWSVHDLLPICEELNIPLVLDYHHHNIVFDATQIREGTKDIMELYPRIKATWDRKGITQKMHYSEPTPAAITPRQRRKHSPRVATLPPCSPGMDLMIEAKDKEQAVLELMRTFKLPGFETFNDILPYARDDDNKIAMAAINKKARSKKSVAAEDESEVQLVPDEEVGMGGRESRIYWPPGMEEWLRPKKREVKKKDPKEKAAAQIKKETEKPNGVVDEDDPDSDENATPATKKAKLAMKRSQKAAASKKTKTDSRKAQPAVESDLESEALKLSDDEDDNKPMTPPRQRMTKSNLSRKASGRSSKKSVNYNEDDERDVEMEAN